MKRMLISLGALGFTITSVYGAANMCVKPDVSVVVLDPAVAPSSNGVSGINWWAQFSYGRVKGIAAVYGTSINGVPDDTHQAAISASTVSSGYCFCKMTSPVVSKWVRWHSGNPNVTNTLTNCRSYCASKCMYNQGASCDRGALYRAVTLP